MRSLSDVLMVKCTLTVRSKTVIYTPGRIPCLLSGQVQQPGGGGCEEVDDEEGGDDSSSDAAPHGEEE